MWDLEKGGNESDRLASEGVIKNRVRLKVGELSDKRFELMKIIDKDGRISFLSVANNAECLERKIVRLDYIRKSL